MQRLCMALILRPQSVLVCITMILANTCAAEDINPVNTAPSYLDSAWQNFSSSFSLPLDQLYVKPYDSEWRNAIHGLSVSVAASHPLTKSTPSNSTNLGNATQGVSATNDTVTIGLKYTPLSYWFASINRRIYLNTDLQKPWDPDWSYSFGYSDWHPWALSLVYSNHLGNDLGGERPAFDAGQLTLSTAFSLPPWLDHVLVSGYGDSIGCNTGLTLTPNISKLTGSFGCKYTIINGFYVNFGLFYYPNSDTQEAWNPDYSYGFGYFDWRPGSISVQYANSSGNRFNKSNSASGTGGFNNGSLSLSWSHSW